MNILFLTSVWPSASELWLHRMIELLEPHVRVFASMSPRESSWRGRIPTEKLLPDWANMLSRVNVTAGVPGLGSRRLEAVLKQYQIDLVFCQYATTAVHFAKVWQRTQVPLWVHCHGYDVTWNLPQKVFPWRRHGRMYQRQLTRLARRAMYIANSQFTKQRMVQAGIPEDRIAVKYYGVPAEAQAVDRSQRGKSVEILYLGRLVDFKGPDLTIQAFERACDQGMQGRLTLAGGGPLEKTCRQLAARSRYADRIRMLGPVTAAQGIQLRAEADIFTAHNGAGAQSGQEEAFGVAFVEAMAAGLPVVTGRSGGLCESVVHGSSGLLFPTGRVDTHARYLLSLARDVGLRHRFGNAAAVRAREMFSPDQERRRLHALFGISTPPAAPETSSAGAPDVHRSTPFHDSCAPSDLMKVL